MRDRRVRNLSDLSPARRRLLENIRRLGFGHIDDLRIRNGNPTFDPPPTIFSDHKYGSKDRLVPLHERKDCELKEQFVALFAEFDERRNFTITRLIVQNGLPIRREVREKPV